jgi:hypothetical protein
MGLRTTTLAGDQCARQLYPSNGPGSEILSDWRYVPRTDACTASK